MRHGSTILEQAEVLGAITEEPGRVTRTYLTAQHREAGDRIIGWMRDAGMDSEGGNSNGAAQRNQVKPLRGALPCNGFHGRDVLLFAGWVALT